MSGSLDQLPRLLALLPYLLSHPGVATAEAARVFGISEARLRKDLELLWVCGLPGHGPGDLIDLEFEGDTITVLEPAGVTRPLRLTADEALALVVALRALAETPGLGDRDAVDRALAKVEAVAGAAAAPAGRYEVALSAPQTDPEREAEAAALPLAREALERARVLHLRYHSAGRGETTERDVDPVRLLLVEGRSYLEAWCRRAEGVRLFRLDRVEGAQVTAEPSAPPPQVALRDLADGLYQPAPEHPLVVLALRPGAHWVADYHPCESVGDRGDGELVVALRVADPAFALRLVLGLGAEAAVLAPPELAERVRDEARRALAGYSGSSGA